LTEYGLALVLHLEAEAGKLAEKMEEKWLAEGAVKKVVRRLKEWFGKKKKWEVNKFVESLEPELVGAVDEAYLTELDKQFEEGDKLEMELDKIMKELRKLKLKEKMERLSGAIKEAEKGKDKKKLARLQRKFVEVAKEIKI
jgi:hypothetical protein